MDSDSNSARGVSRRNFLMTAAGATAAIMTVGAPGVFAQGSDKLRLGLIGAGGRGRHDTTKFLKATQGVDLVAVADVFPERATEAVDALKKEFADRVKVTPEKCFSGFDAYQKLLANGEVDMVILTTPPGFRPLHFRAAVDAGKHVFMEKPVAVDPVGVRSVIESAGVADQKNLKVVAGTQARRMKHRIEMFKRIQDGDIGKIISVECVRLGDGMTDWGPLKERPAGMSDMEWQIRRWLFMTWLSGDFVAEMHVHELDIVNWGLNGVPQKCTALGGRQVRTDPVLFGDAFDHFSAIFEYPEGVRVNYQGCQINGVTTKTYERFYGTKGVAYTDWSGSKIEGEKPYVSEDKDNNDPELQEFADWVQAIRDNKALNEAKRVAESSMTAILCRMSAYCGRELKWDWAMKASKLDLFPAKCEMGPHPLAPICVPGTTPLV